MPATKVANPKPLKRLKLLLYMEYADGSRGEESIGWEFADANASLTYDPGRRITERRYGGYTDYVEYREGPQVLDIHIEGAYAP